MINSMKGLFQPKTAPRRTQRVKNACRKCHNTGPFGFGHTKGLYEHSRQKDKTLKRPKTTLESLCTVFLRNLLTNTEVTEFAVHMLCKDIFREANDTNGHTGNQLLQLKTQHAGSFSSHRNYFKWTKMTSD